MIPKRIFTIWLNDKPIPEDILKWVETHNIEGYEHRLITMDNYYKYNPYVNECIKYKNWVKAVDFLRLYYLNTEGGIYLDADVEVKGNFDNWLHHRMFVFKEGSGYLWNGCIGSEKGHPFLNYILRTMEHNFKAEAETFSAGMQFFTEAYYISDRSTLDMAIYPFDDFKNVAIHHEIKSWTKDKKVTIILPTLNRPEGLKRCLDSIYKLDYPKYLIELIVLDEQEGTLPEKMDKGFKMSTGEYIVFAADDTEFYPDSITLALKDSIENNKGLVAFDTGVRNDEGYTCEHFMIRRDLVHMIGGQIFDLRLRHVGVDDLLWKRCNKLNEAMISKAKLKHYHFSRDWTGVKFDETYRKSWANMERDRETLRMLLNEEGLR